MNSLIWSCTASRSSVSHIANGRYGMQAIIHEFADGRCNMNLFQSYTDGSVVLVSNCDDIKDLALAKQLAENAINNWASRFDKLFSQEKS